MKLSSASVALLSIVALFLPHESSALQCGIKGVTNTCIGETDIRYDPDSSLNIKDQTYFWKTGLTIREQVSYTADGNKATEVYLPGTQEIFQQFNLGSYDASNIKVFANNTVAGSRMIGNQYHLMKHNAGNGTISLPGFVAPFDVYCK